jgi:hypothetical protein
VGMWSKNHCLFVVTACLLVPCCAWLCMLIMLTSSGLDLCYDACVTTSLLLLGMPRFAANCAVVPRDASIMQTDAQTMEPYFPLIV